MQRQKSRAAQIRQNLRSRDWGEYFFVWFVFGALVIHTWADWGIKIWIGFAYVWQAGVHVLAMAAVMQPKYRKYKPILYYAIARLCIQIVTAIMGTDMEAVPIVRFLYLAALVATVYLTVYQYRKQIIASLENIIPYLKKLWNRSS